MNPLHRAIVWAAGAASIAAMVGGLHAAAVEWPPVTRETRPWTRWWWMGSAVDRARLTSELDAFRAAGLGGVEITPIYGAAGAESRFVPFLSNEWLGLLEHTLREAGRIDLGVDMATGTGWPFGGPWVGERDACRTLTYRTWTIESGGRLTDPVRFDQQPMVRAISGRAAGLRDPLEANPNLQALALEQVRYPRSLPLVTLVAYSKTGAPLDLTARVRPDGTLDWIAPEGTWTLYGVFLGWHGKLVERAAPGGEGHVIDHFSRDTIRRYLNHFDEAFAGHRVGGLRALFNDSYEVDDASGQADGTPLLFEEFTRRRGYDLRHHLPALFGVRPDDTAARVLADYRQTVSDLLLETFTAEWRGWAQKHGAIVRNQAHGSPANLLDLYAASDVPETEGTEIPRAKWAASAGHVAGRRLVSAETATWLGEHFTSTLADIRGAVDLLFLAGVNHIVYHGTAYSPAETPWPGWQFYAAVELNDRNPWWTDLRALNDYVTRAQSFLQAGTPDHDVLLYYPFYDALTRRGDGLLRHFGGASPPPDGTVFERAAETLERRGYTYDYVSDRQIEAIRMDGRRLVTSGGRSYAVLVVPASQYIPLETFEKIVSLARGGATIVALNGLPSDVAGLGDLERRRSRFQSLRDAVRGLVVAAEDLERALERAGIAREALVDGGLQFVRRHYQDGRSYFIANRGERDVDGWVPLADRSRAAALFDPATGRAGAAAVRRSAAGTLEVRLTVPRASSLIVVTSDEASGPAYPHFSASGAAVGVSGPWRVRFIRGGPALPAERTVDALASWTTFGGDEVVRFSGTAAYDTTFPMPAGDAPAWRLDLGRVHHSARVRLNGREVGTVLGPSYHLDLDRSLLAASNQLEVEVTNLMANRIAALDKEGFAWRTFYNINFPSRLPENRGPDGLFTAARWQPFDSGLSGPVRLIPLAATAR
jgi:hypothetical protein